MNTESSSNDKEWNEIVAWLQSLNYAHYASLFKSGGYDLWEIIYDLTQSDLREIGIKPGHSNRIQKSLIFKKQQQQMGKNTKSQIASNQKNKQMQPIIPSVASTTTTAPSIKITNSILPISKASTTANNNNIAAIPQIQQLQAMQLEERKRKIRDRFQQNAFFAGGIKNKLFETMTRVLNGLQQELIQYNGKFAEPINEMNQRIVALQRLDVQNLDGIWDSNDGLFEPMMRNISEIKKFNHSMWAKIQEFHNLAESQLKHATKSLQQQINVINNMKTQYLIKQQHINALKRQFALNQNVKNGRRQPPLNTIMVNTNATKEIFREASPSSVVTNFQVTNVYNNNSMNGGDKKNKKHRKKRKKRSKKYHKSSRKPAYTSGELQMMKTYDKKKQTVADIIELQRKMQSIYGIPRSAYGIAQKMYRMGVLSATLPKKLQVCCTLKRHKNIFHNF